MIDVVFLLIIFFIVSNKMIQQETSVELRLPTAKTGMLEDNLELAMRKEVINVRAEGELMLRAQPVTLEELREYFRTKREQGERDLQVVIGTNRDVPAKAIKPILLLCAESGIWNVSFKTIKE